jgi:chromosome segregation ATPase
MEVVFQRLNESTKNGYSSFESLISETSKNSNNNIRNLQNQVQDLNEKIIQKEKMFDSKYKEKVENELKQKQHEIDNFKNTKPTKVKKPSKDTKENDLSMKKIEDLNSQIEQLQVDIKSNQDNLTKLVKDQRKLNSILSEIDTINKSIKNF